MTEKVSILFRHTIQHIESEYAPATNEYMLLQNPYALIRKLNVIRDLLSVIRTTGSVRIIIIEELEND